MIFFLPIFASIAPFVVLAIQRLLPYFFIEEIAKLVLLLPLINYKYDTQQTEPKYSYLLLTSIALLVGILFGVSEAVLYAQNIFLTGTTTLIHRLFLAIPLHTTTSLILFYIADYRKTRVIIALLMAIAVHYVYNLFANVVSQ